MARNFLWAEMDSWEFKPPEIGVPIDESDVVSIDIARDKLEALFDRLATEGFDIQGWEDGTITLDTQLGNAVIQPRRALNKR